MASAIFLFPRTATFLGMGWAIVHEPKKILGIESPLETIFIVPPSIIEIFMHLATVLLVMLLAP